MTVRASWMVWPADPGEDFDYPIMELATAADVDTMIDRHGGPLDDCISLDHLSRLQYVEQDGEQLELFDHDLFAVIRNGYGYLSYQDLCEDGEGKQYSIGNPESPDVQTEDDHFPTGGGLPLDVFRDAVLEFMETTRKPTNIAWRADEEIERPTWIEVCVRYWKIPQGIVFSGPDTLDAILRDMSTSPNGHAPLAEISVGYSSRDRGDGSTEPKMQFGYTDTTGVLRWLPTGEFASLPDLPAHEGATASDEPVVVFDGAAVPSVEGLLAFTPHATRVSPRAVQGAVREFKDTAAKPTAVTWVTVPSGSYSLPQ